MNEIQIDRRAALEALMQAAAKPVQGDNWFSAMDRMAAIERQIRAYENSL